MIDSPAARRPRTAPRLRLRVLLPGVACLMMLPLLSGCTLIGVLASKVVPPPTIAPQYTGMQGQSVAIMAWAPDGTVIDFPNVRLDLAGSLQQKLEQARDAKSRELKGVTFPTPASSIVRLQENRPELEGAPLTDVAPELGASRLVYVEIEFLQTRSDAAVELYRGSASATLKVVEVAADGTAKVAYEESGITAVFPPGAREEGTPDGNDFVMYRGTVQELTSEIAKRFIRHAEE